MTSYRRILAVTIAVGALSFAGPSRAHAGLLLVLSDGIPGDTQSFYTTGTSIVNTTTIDNYTLDINVITTNFPGDGTGLLSTNLTLSTGKTGAISTLTASAYVVNSNDPTDLATFTAPTGASLSSTNDLTGNGGVLGSGSATFTSTAAGVGVGATTATTTNSIPIGGSVESFASNTFSGPSGYTLQSQLVISGLPNGATSINVTGTDTIAAPEPATVAMALSALPFLGLVAYRRRKRSS